MFRISWDMKFEILVEDSNTGGLSSITVRMEYLFAFQFWYFKLCVENWWGGDRKHFFVRICSLMMCFNCLIWCQLKLHLFESRILAEAISMMHSGMLYWLDSSTLYFYESSLFQIFINSKSLKIWTFSGLLHFYSQQPYRQPFLWIYLFVSNIMQY